MNDLNYYRLLTSISEISPQWETFGLHLAEQAAAHTLPQEREQVLDLLARMRNYVSRKPGPDLKVTAERLAEEAVSDAARAVAKACLMSMEQACALAERAYGRDLVLTLIAEEVYEYSPQSAETALVLSLAEKGAATETLFVAARALYNASYDEVCHCRTDPPQGLVAALTTGALQGASSTVLLSLVYVTQSLQETRLEPAELEVAYRLVLDGTSAHLARQYARALH